MCFLFGRRRNNVFLSQLLWENTLLLFLFSAHSSASPDYFRFCPPKTIKACQKTQLFNRKHHPLPRPLGGASSQVPAATALQIFPQLFEAFGRLREEGHPFLSQLAQREAESWEKAHPEDPDAGWEGPDFLDRFLVGLKGMIFFYEYGHFKGKLDDEP